jgi:hypothetical protein
MLLVLSADALRGSEASCRDPGTGPPAAPPTVAAQTRIVSKARIRLDSRKSVRSFKGIICVDISEFESYMPRSGALLGHGAQLVRPRAVDRSASAYRRKGKKSPRTLRKTAGLSVRLLAGWGPRGRESVRRFLEARCALPRNHVVVKHSADSGCVGHPVAKCREAPLLFSAVNLRSQDRRGKRYRRGACRGS